MAHDYDKLKITANTDNKASHNLIQVWFKAAAWPGPWLARVTDIAEFAAQPQTPADDWPATTSTAPVQVIDIYWSRVDRRHSVSVMGNRGLPVVCKTWHLTNKTKFGCWYQQPAESVKQHSCSVYMSVNFAMTTLLTRKLRTRPDVTPQMGRYDYCSMSMPSNVNLTVRSQSDLSMVSRENSALIFFTVCAR